MINKHISDPWIDDIKLQLASGNPYLADSKKASDKFKVVFCEWMGITLHKYFTTHTFDKNSVKCHLDNAFDITLSLQYD